MRVLKNQIGESQEKMSCKGKRKAQCYGVGSKDLIQPGVREGFPEEETCKGTQSGWEEPVS